MGSGDGTIRLEYARPGRPWWQVARWWHWALLGLWCVVFAAGVVLLFNPLVWEQERWGWGIYGTPAAPVEDINGNSDEARYRWQAAAYLGAFLLTQWLFLLPRGSWRIRLVDDGRPRKRAVIVAGLVAMLVSVAFLATVLDPWGGWMRLTAWNDTAHVWVIWVIMLGVWAVWAVLFWRYGRSLDRYTFLSRIVRLLVAGTILETVVAGAVYAWVENEDNCHCARGSYTGMVFGLTAGVWLFGPGLALLWWREKKRRERLAA